MKAGKPVVAPGAGNLAKPEPRAGTQSVKIELKKPAAGSKASPGGGTGGGMPRGTSAGPRLPGPAGRPLLTLPALPDPGMASG